MVPGFNFKQGSNDAGKTVHDDESVVEIMKKAASLLKLKGHLVGSSKKLIYGPGDIEVHRGTDNRIYIVDTARIFCPEVWFCTFSDSVRHLLPPSPYLEVSSIDS